MKANGFKINVMVADLKFLLTGIRIRETIRMVSRTVEEFTLGRTGKFMMESGNTELKMAMESGKEHPVNHISVNGWTAKHKDMEFTCGKITISTKASGIKISDTVMEVIFFTMEMCTLASTFMANLKVLDSTSGKTALLILAPS